MSRETTEARAAARHALEAWQDHLRMCGPCHAAAKADRPARLCQDGKRLRTVRRGADAELRRNLELDSQPGPEQATLW